ncbi:sphingosine-1-phosphate phosphatase 2 [Leptinotarsa decemlineata]|uniref:sphingosine-1-phosphate phosphatase 2 n=1 Tax=Leptinotarsa decemlineata TaxID=7539 RepID=UPI003D30727E
MNYLKNPVLVARIQYFFGVKTEIKATHEQKKEKSNNKYIIENRFWYYLFLFGTALGDETFYAFFIPFWFWNIDGAVGRRFVLVWSIVMYIGQGIKDIIRWPRPGPPVVQLQNKWAVEYGMPSTHAMVGVSIPFSVFLFTLNRYQYSTSLGLSVAILWCTLICVSRLYLGMHTILDIIVGLILAVLIMCVMVPFVDLLDDYLLRSSTSPLLLLVSSILMIVYYPNSGKWTPTRGDTTMIISVCVGIHIGAWLNFQTGLMTPTELAAPYVIMWPSYTMLGCMVMRTSIGFTCVILSKDICKNLTYNFLCTLLKEDVDNLKKSENTLQNKHKTFVELCYKYIYCSMVGFNTVYLLPQLFRFLRIERPTFFTGI